MDMSNEIRKKTQYQGYVIVAAFWHGKHQSQVTFNKKALARFVGDDLDDAFRKAFIFAKSEYEKTLPKFHRQNHNTMPNNTVYYKNASLLVVFENGYFTGIVKSGQKILFEENKFQTDEDALQRLKKFVDKNLGTIHEEFLQRHRSYLHSKGIETTGNTVRENNTALKRRRTSHCWSCRHPVDNQIQHECTSCGWIICTCGTCGCGYRGY